MLADAARATPAACALRDAERQLSYAAYADCVQRFCAELGAARLSGQRVAIALDDGIDFCIAVYAAFCAGAQVCPLDTGYDDASFAHALRDASPAALISGAALCRRLAPLLGGAPTIVPRGVGAAGRNPNAAALPLPDPDSLALLCYTPGERGAPARGVNLCHRAVAVNVSQREQRAPTPRAPRVLCTLPRHRLHALALGQNLACYRRGTLVLLDDNAPAALLAALGRFRISVLAAAPSDYAALLHAAADDATAFADLSVCYASAPAADAKQWRRWRERAGAPVLEIYGRSEAVPLLTCSPPDGPQRIGSVGLGLPQTVIEVVDAEDRVLDAGRRGQIRARGPQLMDGYRNRPGDTERTLRRGWFYTGDFGRLDADGYLYIDSDAAG